MKIFLQLIRVSNWLKNVFILFPLVFSLKLFDTSSIASTSIAIGAFSFLSSFIYILNDIKDIEKDKLHERKKLRPLPAGLITIKSAILIAIVLLFVAITFALLLPVKAQLILLIYLLLSIAYIYVLKNVNLVEMIIVSSNFLLRILTGCFAIGVAPSHWILAITFFVALFLTLIKRRSELILLDTSAVHHRKVLENYSVELLNGFIVITASLTILSYILYTIDPVVIHTFHTNMIFYSSIFVILAVFRFFQIAYLGVHKNDGDPTTIIFQDRFIQVVAMCWMAYVVLVLYFSTTL